MVGVETMGPSTDPYRTQVIAKAVPPTGFAGNPRLVLSTDGNTSAGREGVERAVQLLTPVTIIGRGHDAQLRLSDPGVSRHHAQVELRGGAVWLEDLGSTNGTTLDGAPVSAPTQMTSGQRIAMGSSVLVFLRDPGGS